MPFQEGEVFSPLGNHMTDEIVRKAVPKLIRKKGLKEKEIQVTSCIRSLDKITMRR